jgi:predicted nucleic acid-binding protein
MKVIIADTSPLNYLVLVGEVDVLARLYGEVLIPDVVAAELSSASEHRQAQEEADRPYQPPQRSKDRTMVSDQSTTRFSSALAFAVELDWKQRRKSTETPTCRTSSRSPARL